MAILHVRNFPTDLYQYIQEQAATENRSLSAQVIMLLQSAVESAHKRRSQAEILSEIRRRRVQPSPGTLDSATLLREDRDR